MKKLKLKPLIIVAIVFAFIGLSFFAVGLKTLIFGLANKTDVVEIDAIISCIENDRDSSGDTSHDVYVNYEYDGEEYTNVPLNYYSSSMYEGKNITIKINPDNPSEPSNTMLVVLFGGVFGGIGFIFLVIGLVLIINNCKKNSENKKLINDGYYIDAEIDMVDTSGVVVNGRPTYVIRCSYNNPSDGRVYQFTSDTLSSDPTSLISGNTIRVYVDRNNFKKNYVDISEIEEKIVIC